MNMTCFAYTQKGAGLLTKLLPLLSALPPEGNGRISAFVPARYAAPPLFPLAGDDSVYQHAFENCDLIVFIGAAGIAFRKLAPYIHHKTTDPAVLCLDDGGRFVIPLLSGHIGGANRFAAKIADAIGATPVITTATDTNGVFAADEWAVENSLAIQNPDAIRLVSAALLDGRPVGILADIPIEGALPPGLYAADRGEIGIAVTTKIDAAPFAATLHLVPRCIIAGIGCRKNTAPSLLEDFLVDTLATMGVSLEALAALASINLKAEEPALLALAEKYRLPFHTFSPEELAALPGQFDASPFVQSVTGVDNVCQRAALLAARQMGASGQLLTPKLAREGVTLALCQFPLTARWPHA